MKAFERFDYIIIVGVTGSGKSTLLNWLIRNCDDSTRRLKLLKKWTSRPMRESEIPILDKFQEYIFTTEEDIDQLEDDGMILFQNKYDSANGVYAYGFPTYNNPNEDYTYIQALGAGDMLTILENDMLPKKNLLLINMRVDKFSVISKLKNRNDAKETSRRINADFRTFSYGYGKLFGLDKNDVLWDRVKGSFHDDNGNLYVEVRNHGYKMSIEDIASILLATNIIPHEITKMTIRHMKNVENGVGIHMYQY